MRRLKIALLLLSAHAAWATTPDKHCTDSFQREPTPPTISKELNSIEFGHPGHSKWMSCCAVDYDSIEWFKDGVPLTSPNTTFYVSESERNQTIESKYVQAGDQGNYTCVARNNSYAEPKMHTISFQIEYEASSPGSPIITHHPTDQYALPGETARFYCEALVGYGGIVNTSEVYWVAADEPLHFVYDVRNVNVSDVIRDNGSIKGSELIFESVTNKDYGRYICHVDNNRQKILNLNASLINGVNPNMKVVHSYKVTVIIICVFIAVTTLAVSSYIQWNLEILLFWKDRFGKIEENDNMEFDVFVCYDEEDSGFALDVLVATLETAYGYKCFAYQRDSLAGDWIPETYTNAVRKSRRFLMVLSPALAANNWCIYALYIAIEALLNLHSKIICVELQNVSWDEIALSASNVNDTTLRHVLNVVKKVCWDPGCVSATTASENLNLIDTEFYAKGSKTFWKKLRLHLPPRRMLQ